MVCIHVAISAAYVLPKALIGNIHHNCSLAVKPSELLCAPYQDLLYVISL